MDARICGNGHVFPDVQGSCTECDSIASRPATTEEKRLAGMGPGGPPTTGRPGGFGVLLGLGAGFVVLGNLVVAVSGGSVFIALIGVLIALGGAGMALAAVIGFGVREGIASYVHQRDADAARAAQAGQTPQSGRILD